MPRDARKYLFDIGEASNLISQFVAGKTLGDDRHASKENSSSCRSQPAGARHPESVGGYRLGTNRGLCEASGGHSSGAIKDFGPEKTRCHTEDRTACSAPRKTSGCV